MKKNREPLLPMNIAILLELVTRALPPLPLGFNGMEQLAQILAVKVKGKPDKKTVEKILLELMAFHEFAFVNAVFELEEMHPDEVHFTHSAIRKVFMELTAGEHPTLLRDPEVLDEKLNALFKVVEEHFGEAIDINFIAEYIGKAIYGKKKPDPEFLATLITWMLEYFETTIGFFEPLLENPILPGPKPYPAGPEVEELVRDMKEAAPIPVIIGPEILKSLKQQGVKMKKNEVVNVINAIDSGNINGIICMVDIGKQELLGIPMTHLTVADGHPLKSRIEKYQEECAHVDAG